MTASKAEPGPTPLIVRYVTSTPRKQASASAARNSQGGIGLRRTSMEYRHNAQAINAPVIQIGRNGRCASSANARATRVQGRLASNEPSVPRALAIVVVQPVQGQRFQALAAMGLAVCGGE